MKILSCGLLAALLSVTTPRAVAAQAVILVDIVGTVWDSISNKRLPGGVVRLVRVEDPSVGRSAVSDSAGSFRIDSIAAGQWLGTFIHPVLDSLRVEANVVRIHVVEAGTLEVDMATPSPRTLAVNACRSIPAVGEGIWIGKVRRALDDANLSGASVLATWSEWTVREKSLSRQQRSVTAESDSLGNFIVCGVPAGTSVIGRAAFMADSTGDIQIDIGAQGLAVRDLLLNTGLVVAGPRAQGASDRGAPTAGRATVRGFVRTPDGEPVPNAIVRVIGSGSATRTSVTGEFVIADAAAGSQSVEARLLGYVPDRTAIDLRAEVPAEVNLTLAVQQVLLDSVRVTAEVPPRVQGIERRARLGVGSIFSGDVVRARSTLFVTDVLRGMNGLTVTSRSQGSQVQMRGTDGRLCDPFIYIDGAFIDVGGETVTSLTIDDLVSLQDVAAVEVYERPSRVPPEFSGGLRGCGAILVWSRRGTGNVPVRLPK